MISVFFLFSLPLNLSLSSFSVWCGVCLCVLCVAVCVAVCVSVCVVWCGVCRVVWHAENLRVYIQKRPRACRQHAHMLFNMCAWCPYTRGRFESRHGGQGGVIVSSAYQNLPALGHHLAQPDSQPGRQKERHRQTETQTDRQRQRLNAKRPVCQSNQSRDACQNSLAVAELHRARWAHVNLSRSIAHTLVDKCTIKNFISAFVLCCVCVQVFFAAPAHYALHC